MTAEQLKHLIATRVDCEHLDVNGDGHHWFATIVSSEFEGKNRVARHQVVHAALDEELASNAVHALSMKNFTPAEWAAREGA